MLFFLSLALFSDVMSLNIVQMGAGLNKLKKNVTLATKHESAAAEIYRESMRNRRRQSEASQRNALGYEPMILGEIL